MMRAGEGICEQADVPAAIDTNLGCVFKQASDRLGADQSLRLSLVQVSDEKFGKCLRMTIGSLKHFNLRALKEVLPKFVECVEPMVMQTCGPVPLNVLKALGSKNTCPVESSSKAFQAISTTPPPLAAKKEQPKCSAELFELYDRCQHPFYSKYDFLPGALVNQTSVGVDEVGWLDLQRPMPNI